MKITQQVLKTLTWMFLAFGSLVYMGNVDPGPAAERPMAVGSPAELASRMDCTPANSTVSGANKVVYRFDGDWMIGGKGIIAKASDQFLGGTDYGIKVYAFCKG